MNQKTEKAGMILGGFATNIVMALVFGLFYSWILMLLLGLIHNNFSEAVPAAGYWLCFWPAYLFRILVSSVSMGSSNG